ncbi:MAG: phytoene desaturase family protein [Acidimicrobiales bacterium]
MSELDAIVIGAGPNGLGAAITLAEAGASVLLIDKFAEPGGALRSAELTLPGFVHDLGASVFPLAALSPLIASSATTNHGLDWSHPAVPAAHPLGDSAVALYHDFDQTLEGLGKGAGTYKRLLSAFLESPEASLEIALGPVFRWPTRPLHTAGLGARLLIPPRVTATAMRSASAAALWAGIAAHGVVPLRQPIAGGFALTLAAAAHINGWPFAAGGAGSISRALMARFEAAGGKAEFSTEINQLNELPPFRAAFFDTAPEKLVTISQGHLTRRIARRLRNTKRTTSIYKIDYALDGPIPWHDPVSCQAGTVHVGGSFKEIAGSLSETAKGSVPDNPFVIVTQPSVADSTRAPKGKQVAWAYCHVPFGCEQDMTESIERQIERFAPGFRDVVLARHAWNLDTLPGVSPNLVRGDITGGTQGGIYGFRRPTISTEPWRIPGDRCIYLCSASTPPGGGVHAMCGVHAANAALHHDLS